MSRVKKPAVNGISRHIATVLCSENPSVKRLAWAFGCSKRDSDEERQLYVLLREHFERVIADRNARQESP